MIHHAIFGSLSRMIAILLEHHGGVLPFWLSPDQVAVAPISKDQAGYGAEVLAAFRDAGIRAVAYDGADTLSRRIVAAHEMSVPVMAIVGGREMRNGGVRLRERDGSQADVPLAEAVSRLQARARLRAHHGARNGPEPSAPEARPGTTKGSHTSGVRPLPRSEAD